MVQLTASEFRVLDLYTLDGVPYLELDMKYIPNGFGEVDVQVDDNGEKFPCKMVSGHVAATMSTSKEDGAYDTLSPAPQWFLYVKADKPRRGYEEEEAEALDRILRKWGLGKYGEGSGGS